MRYTAAILIILASSALVSSARAGEPSETAPEVFIQGEGGLSFLSEIGSFEAAAGTFGYGGQVGWRWGDWGAFVSLEHNVWLLTKVSNAPVDSVLNLGLGGEVLYHDRRVRTSLTVGTSTALFSTVLDDFGSTGFFVDLRPLAYRLPLDEGLTVSIAPLSILVMVPIIEGIPLVQLSHRGVLSLETSF